MKHAPRTWSGSNKRSWFAAMLLCCLSPLICGALPSRPAHATDALVPAAGVGQADGRFLRLGLAKSAVIKLPASAKDVIIGETEIVDVVLRNKKTAYLFARRAGQTNLFFFDADGREILHLDLEVTLDTKSVKKLIDRSIPGNRIEVDSTGPNVVLKGTASSAQEARIAEELASRAIGGTASANGETGTPGVINLLKIASGDQVMLKVRVVELRRSVLKQLGINIEAAFSVGALDFSFNNTPAAGIGGVGERVLDSAMGWASGGQSIDVKLKALEKQGLLTTLAEPTLTAISGASASFRAGGEFPYTVCEGVNTGDNCSVEFKPYGVALGFTPTVLSEGRIALNINTEVSEIAQFVLGVPAIDIRKAQTSVEMPSGGSMMLAGLIKDVTSQTLQGTPGLRTLPVLGALFSSRDYQKNQTELVVIVTPYIVKAVHESDLATPLDGFNPPTDLQQIFLGRLNRVYGAGGQKADGIYYGKVGHIIE